jgi:hypothetical protein
LSRTTNCQFIKWVHFECRHGIPNISSNRRTAFALLLFSLTFVPQSRKRDLGKQEEDLMDFKAELPDGIFSDQKAKFG